jgi:hypothetical protein
MDACMRRFASFLNTLRGSHFLDIYGSFVAACRPKIYPAFHAFQMATISGCSLTRSIRLGTFTDLPRVALVAAAGFFHLETFAYERPYYDHFAQDTVSDYHDRYLAVMEDPDRVLLVVEDIYEDNEKLHVDSYLRILGDGLLERKEKVVVGVATMSLQGGPRKNTFQPEGT